jgi:Family of unknown function (DUF5693)
VRQGRNSGTESRYRGVLAAVIALALLACAYVAVWRLHVESQARRVELALDYGDFSNMARAYNYNERELLVALRRAGLTSVAVSEELGGGVNGNAGALLVPGRQVLDQAHLSVVSEPTLAALLRAHDVRADEVYLLISDPRELPRYQAALARHFQPSSIRKVAPMVFAIRSQVDYVNGLGLGLPVTTLALVRDAGLLLIPRVQNDDRYGKPEIEGLMDSFKDGKQRVSTIIFFGQRNEVLGFPNHLDDTAEAFRRNGYNFGAIETYDRVQVQKGSERLGELIPGQTTRVQAIAKAEQEKLDFRTVVARYLLGVRERNVRVVYLRPLLHPDGVASIQQTNITLVRAIADGLRACGFRLGRATPVRDIVMPPLVIFLASLAVPALCLLLCEKFGWRSQRYALFAFALDTFLVIGGYALHHDLLVRKLLALCGAVLFALAGVVAISRAFRAPTLATFGESVAAGVRTTLTATCVSLAGALLTVGLLSVALLMEEIQVFSGVKLVIIVPPIAALCAYLYTRRFRSDPLDARVSVLEPVLWYQALMGVFLLGAAFVYIARSGNQSDITPSTFELSLRSGMTAVLGVRPRFKEFLIGFPLMMLLPALRLEHRRIMGWVFALAIGIGTADIIDTFSHLHTPLLVSLVRLGNGLLIGVVLGIAAIALYRRCAYRCSRA